MDKKSLMEYRYLGRTGLKVSLLSFGNMVNVHGDDAQERHNEIVAKLLENGVNFFDTAEAYGFGKAEVLLGQSLKDLKVKREDVVISTKIFWSGMYGGVNSSGLSRKHIIEAARNCLKRL